MRRDRLINSVLCESPLDMFSWTFTLFLISVVKSGCLNSEHYVNCFSGNKYTFANFWESSYYNFTRKRVIIYILWVLLIVLRNSWRCYSDHNASFVFTLSRIRLLFKMFLWRKKNVLINLGDSLIDSTNSSVQSKYFRFMSQLFNAIRTPFFIVSIYLSSW